MFMAMTSNRAFWALDDELLFLGPWCTRYDRRHEWDGLNYRMLPNPWDDRKRLDDAVHYILQVQGHVMAELGSYLNKIHEVSYSARYWQILVGFWLNYYTHTLYSRYVHIRSALELFPDIRTCSLDPECWTTPRNTAESVTFLDTDRYNLQLCSQVLRALGHETRMQTLKSLGEDAGNGRAPAGKIPPFLLLAGRYIRQGLNSLRSPKSDIVLCDLNFRTRYLWAILRATGFRAWPLIENLSAEACGEVKPGPHRSGLGQLFARDEFERVLVATLPDNLPALFLEGYAKARRGCRTEWKTPPRLLVSSVGWMWNDYFKLVAAECGEQGSRLVGIQHGGGYGFLWRTLASEVLEQAICDRWYAWGWSSLSANRNVKDLPSPHLSQIGLTRSNFETKQILFVGTDRALFLGYVVHCPMEAQFEQYLAWQLKFMAALPDEVSKRLLVRLFPIDRGWNVAQRLKDAVPTIRIDDGSRTFEERLKHSQLAVFDHPSTTCLEGLVSGVPCLLFWNPDHWECRPSAVSYLNQLRRAGVLFHDPGAASAQLLKISEDPLTWWLSEPVREAREKFAENFAFHSPRWVDSWVAELKTEATLSRVSAER